MYCVIDHYTNKHGTLLCHGLDTMIYDCIMDHYIAKYGSSVMYTVNFTMSYTITQKYGNAVIYVHCDFTMSQANMEVVLMYPEAFVSYQIFSIFL